MNMGRCFTALIIVLSLGVTNMMAKSLREHSSKGKHPVLILARDGRSDYTIVISNDASPTERHAANELRNFLEQICGARLPIVTDEQSVSGPMICVGWSRAVQRLDVNVDLASLGKEGFIIKTVPPHLIIVGGRLRGTMYGCYTFLEDYLGCRWFTPDCTRIPKLRTIKLPSINRRYVPPLEYRATDYPNSRDPDWAVRNKVNGHLPPIDEQRGGHVTYYPFVHTFNALIPPQEFFEDHPEYFSLVRGERLRDRTQLCLTNPEVIQLGIERLREWIRSHPDVMIFSVSQNDWHNYCECTRCSALAEYEGSQSGPIIHYVNALADAIRDEYPDKAIDTLAYTYSRKPPKHVRPRPNVIVRLCSIECCFSHPLESCPVNASFVRDIKGWSKVCNRLYIWDYVINYAHSIMPHPNLYVLKPNINFFIRHGVKGIYEEANYFSKGGEFAELRTWIMAKVLWDPSYDTDKAIDEFLEAYYEEAAKPIRRYINLIHKVVRENSNLHMHIWSPPTSGYLSPRIIKQAVKLFDEAERLVRHKPKILHRVQVARLPIMYVQIMRASPKYRRVGDKFVPMGYEQLKQLTDQFERIARKEGVARVREARSGVLNQWLAQVRKPMKELHILTLRNGRLIVEIIPERGGRIYRIYDRVWRRQILRVASPNDPLYPGTGGYEEYSEGEYRTPGWEETFAVEKHTERAVTLSAKLRNGLQLQRHIEVHPERPIIHIRSTLMNVTDRTISACLRVHAEFRLAPIQRTIVKLLRHSGRWVTKKLTFRRDETERQIFLREDDIPAGSWMVVDTKTGLAVVNDFSTSQVGQCLLNWCRKPHRVNLELYSPQVQLKPGQKISIDHSYTLMRVGKL
ncbi:MAG TPA: DUF4838 domain-containing protein [Armatimonadetes bacterium]|nr:DUF4838 domain-containing protein [Armatimonadota bacterium]